MSRAGQDTTPLNVFIALSRYLVPIQQVEALLPEHARWVAQRYAEGRILVSGRQIPARGGATILVGPDRQSVETLFSTDPFVQNGVAEYTIIEFVPSDGDRRSMDFAAFLARQ